VFGFGSPLVHVDAPGYPPAVLSLDTDIGKSPKTFTLGKGTTLIATMRSSHSRPRRLRRTVVALAVPALFLAACGSSSKSSGSGTANFQAGQGNAGVAQTVSSTDGAIGYVDFSDAKAAGLNFASVKNSSGTFIAPTLESAAASVASAQIETDLTYSPLNASGADAYPITSPTWIIVYAKQTDATQGKAVKAFLNYALTDGQALAEGANFAQLPDSLAQKAVSQLARLEIPAGGSDGATLNGSGSTFQKAFDQVVIEAFTKANSGNTVNYAGGGSGKGKTDLQTKTVDFAGTDSLVKAEDLSSYQGGAILYFPLVSAPITMSYNLSGVDKLQLSADTIAKIFSGGITKWNDAAIAADNPGVTLPDTGITVVHRADASGTTSNFTKYLTLAAPDAWTLGTGDTVNWPS
jgi:ABC-type phosphate transport system substrate-binding protein